MGNVDMPTITANASARVAAAAPIEESVAMDVNFPTVSERYFEHYYFVDDRKSWLGKVKKEENDNIEKRLNEECHVDKKMKVGVNDVVSGEVHRENAADADVCVMVHTNNLCVLTLASGHPIVTQGKTIKQVSFQVGGQDRLANKVSGKGKKGAQGLGPHSQICKITCTDGEAFVLPAGVKGKLVQVNERLLKSPELIVSHRNSEGFLAVVLQGLRDRESNIKPLLNVDDYRRLRNLC